MNENILIEEIKSLGKNIKEKQAQYSEIKRAHLLGKYFVRDEKCFHIVYVEVSWLKAIGSFHINVNAFHVNSKGEDSDQKKYLLYKDEPLSDSPILQPPHTEIYRGILSFDSNGEEDNLLSIDDGDSFFGDSFLAETIADHIDKYGNRLTVCYWLSDQKLTKEELTEAFLKQLMGGSEAKYNVRYSECTDYLFTTEEIQVGGHDLLAELKDAIGQYLHMEIVFDF